jgi:hypothetical protein
MSAILVAYEKNLRQKLNITVFYILFASGINLHQELHISHIYKYM